MTVRWRTVIWAAAVTVVLAIASPFVLFALYIASTGGAGSPEEAARLRKVVEAIPDPEAGEGCDPGYSAHRFPNGEWVLGIGRDSHAPFSRWEGGGTVVLKDSRGQVRAYFGHVCGSAGHSPFWHYAKSLDEYYETIVKYNDFTEYHFP